MAIKYTIDDKLTVLNAMLDEYCAWFIEVTKAIAYEGGQDKIKNPSSFTKWVEKVDFEAINVDGRYLAQRDQLATLHTALLMDADALLKKAPVPRDAYEKFSALFRSFISGAQALCRNVVLEEWGLDVLTGLKNKKILRADLDLEMERLGREGQSFAIGLVRINHFEELLDHPDKNLADQLLKKVAGLILSSLRPFDDAYRLEAGHYFLTLKQSDANGGHSAMERLRNALEDADVSYDVNGEKKILTLACCVASPFPEDDVSTLMDNLYTDLEKQSKEQGAVLTYQEISPLERFAKTGKAD